MNQFHQNPTTSVFRSLMAINTCTSFVAECEFDYEDDDFYAELRKQILLLTDEESPEHPSSSRVTRQNGNALNTAVASRSYGRWGENEISTGPAPAWLLKLWGNGSGTGVFIPHIVKPKRMPGTYISFYPRTESWACLFTVFENCYFFYEKTSTSKIQNIFHVLKNCSQEQSSKRGTNSLMIFNQFRSMLNSWVFFQQGGTRQEGECTRKWRTGINSQ